MGKTVEILEINQHKTFVAANLSRNYSNLKKKKKKQILQIVKHISALGV